MKSGKIDVHFVFLVYFTQLKLFPGNPKMHDGMLGPKTIQAGLKYKKKQLVELGKIVEKEIEDINQELLVIAGETALDVCGIFEPTPFCDISAGALAIKRGDYWGAALSFLSVIPYLGDAVAKPAKGTKTGLRIAKLQKRLVGLQKRMEKITIIRKEVNATLENSKKALKKKSTKKPKNKKKTKEKKGQKGKWGCTDVRCNVYPNPKATPPNKNCPDRVIGNVPYIYPSYAAACSAAQKAANLLVPDGCVKRHCNCRTKCTKK